MLLHVPRPHRAALFDLARLQCGRDTVEDEHQADAMFGDESCDAVKQSGQVRGDPAPGILQRRSVAQANEREELVELAMGVHRERAAAECRKRDRLLRDDGREDDAHYSTRRFPSNLIRKRASPRTISSPCRRRTPTEPGGTATVLPLR